MAVTAACTNVGANQHVGVWIVGEDKPEGGDIGLPEPSELPVSPDELEAHRVLPGFEDFYKAPPADSYTDPLDMPQWQPNGLQPHYPPLLPGAPGTAPQDRLKIKPSVLRGAANGADKIYDAFRAPAASLEDPAKKATSALAGWASAKGIHAAHKQWEQQAGTVTGWLAHIAESLRAGANDYGKTDAAVYDSLKAIRPRSGLDDL
ncbi:hypothetical protein ACIBI4_24100 [Streptomyces sp. NPDC050418]|uniref:hypothetical protein n=1 Tax=Streptomyces sp. NPDC050418 TaxID=3365612 RepID=UPI003796AEB4